MREIVIDITNLTDTSFITGIQRVVQEVTMQFCSMIPDRLKLVAEKKGKAGEFYTVSIESFRDHYANREKEFVIAENQVNLEDIAENIILFDIDSVWANPYCRTDFYPALKEKGAKIATFVHDVIPVTDPQYCGEGTVFKFLGYLGAILQYDDLILTSTQSTVNEIENLEKRLGIERKPSAATWLGAEFGKNNEALGSINSEIKALAGEKYVLCVGTIEPRKNQTYILDAFEKELFETDIKCVFAGREGWNVSSLVERMKKLPEFNEKFFWFSGLDDANINYLYEHAFLMAFPTINEGFGLPIVEALQRGVPVIAHDKPVLKEVGGDYCRYFSIEETDEFISLVKYYSDHPDEYNKWKQDLKTYQPVSWKKTAENMLTALSKLSD